jgi:hypothetical protein
LGDLVPAPIAPLIGFILGVIFAWGAADELGRNAGRVEGSRSFVIVTAFSLLVFAPVSAYFLAFAPDWSYAYLVDSQRLPSAVDLGLVLIDVVSVPTGFALAARSASFQELTRLVRLSALPALLVTSFVLATGQRLSVAATHAQYHGDFGTRSLAGSPTGYALLWMSAVLVGGVMWTLHSLRKLGRTT